jgi:hypothetical protein
VRQTRSVSPGRVRRALTPATRLALATAVAVPALAVPTLAAGPPGGARYRGTTSQHRSLDARVTSDGRGLQLTFDQVFDCNRGPSKTTHSVYLEERPTIRADGAFDYVKTYSHLAPVPGFEELHTERQHVRGSFTHGGLRLTGTDTDTTTGADGLRCTSAVSFTARRIA